MRAVKLVIPVLAAVCVAAGCGEAESPTASSDRDAKSTEPNTVGTRGTDARERETDTRRGTRLTARDSQFGTMLFDAGRRAIYIFERDSEDESVCYGECAEAWPPVLTKGRPIAANGVRQQLLGAVKRRDGTRQVTYAGQPLYYYAHETPGEVRCHNVNLNGGFWWVIGPDGKRRP